MGTTGRVSAPPASSTLGYLESAEANELNPHLRDDYRIAWITVLRASRGELWPHVSATYAVLGLHPEKVWPAIVAHRKAKLGSCYESWWAGKILPPKKPAQSEKLYRKRAAA